MGVAALLGGIIELSGALLNILVHAINRKVKSNSQDSHSIQIIINETYQPHYINLPCQGSFIEAKEPP